MALWGLQQLTLRGNRIGDEGAEPLADALKANASLQLLDLSETGISNEGGQALAKALWTNEGLLQLHLEGNGIGEEVPFKLEGGVARPGKIRQILSADICRGGLGVSQLVASFHSYAHS